MNDHVGGLIDDRHVVVLVKDVEGYVFGNRRLSGRLDESKRNDGAGLESKRRLAVDSVDVDALFRLNRLANQTFVDVFNDRLIVANFGHGISKLL